MESPFDKFADTAFVSVYGGMFPLSSAFRHSFRLAHLSPVVHAPEQRCPILKRRKNVLARVASAFESRRTWSGKRFTGFQKQAIRKSGQSIDAGDCTCFVRSRGRMA